MILSSLFKKSQPKHKKSQYKKLDNKDKLDSKQFSVIVTKQGKKKVKLNFQYQLKPQDDFYQTIQFLLPGITHKSTNFHKQLISKFNISFFSSLQMILSNHKQQQQSCTICLQNFTIQKVQQQLCQHNDNDIYILPCTHKYHIGCLISLIGQKHHIKCSICGVIYGELIGDQPDGEMTITIDKNNKIQGYKDAQGVIIIHYSMKSGIRNGVNYQGTRRKAYLPNNHQGKEVLELFKIAFDRKLIFTVGRSVTSGLDNQTVWNGIHHKTSLTGGSAGFGYPDETYLKRVKEELALKGITIDCLKKK